MISVSSKDTHGFSVLTASEEAINTMLGGNQDHAQSLQLLSPKKG